MIFVSSACSKKRKISQSVKELADNGFTNIELTGGTEYYDLFENDLIQLKKEYKLNYQLHNYFPPPQQKFVINLASLDNNLYTQTLQHLRNALDLTSKFGANKFGFHAGFYIDFNVDSIGKKISSYKSLDREQAFRKFCAGFNILKNVGSDFFASYACIKIT